MSQELKKYLMGAFALAVCVFGFTACEKSDRDKAKDHMSEMKGEMEKAKKEAEPMMDEAKKEADSMMDGMRDY